MPVPLPKDRRRKSRLAAMASALACAAFVAFAIVISGCGDSTSARPAIDVGTGAATPTAKGPITKETVEKIVTRKLGDTAAAGQPIIRSLTLTPEANGQFINIDLNRTSSCHPGALTGTTVTISQQVMSSLFVYPDVGRVQVTIYGTTENIADKDKPATTVMVTKEAASKIDWFQFNDSTVEKMASSFWADPIVYANWKQYGGAQITDEAKKAAANAAAAAGITSTTPAAATP